LGSHNQTAINRRVADIYGLVVDGMPLAAICRYVAGNCTWTASERSICRYIARARAIMLEQAKTERREVFAESLARKQLLYARAVSSKQWKTALAIQNSIDRMFGDFAGMHDDRDEIRRFLDAIEGGGAE
jgi:hypothetical protein